MNKSKLNQHVLNHTGANVEECDICHKKLLHGNMKRHKLIHIGLKLYKCKVCGKSYSQSGQLK